VFAGNTSGIFDIGSKLGTKGFQRLPSNSPVVNAGAAPADGFYYRLFGNEKPVSDDAKVADEVSVFNWDTANEQHETVAHWNAFMTHKDQHFYIEAPSIMSPPSKESLVALLEMAEDFGCKSAFVCVEKSNPKLSELIRVFLYLGFHMMDPVLIQKTIGREVKDYVLLGYNLE